MTETREVYITKDLEKVANRVIKDYRLRSVDFRAFPSVPYLWKMIYTGSTKAPLTTKVLN